MNREWENRLEITLTNGKRFVMIIPAPLPKGEKERLKAIIDLMLEEGEGEEEEGGER